MLKAFPNLTKSDILHLKCISNCDDTIVHTLRKENNLKYTHLPKYTEILYPTNDFKKFFRATKSPVLFEYVLN